LNSLRISLKKRKKISQQKLLPLKKLPKRRRIMSQ
jgi:hypothetical protein